MSLDHAFEFVEQSAREVSNVFDIKSFSFLKFKT